MFQTESVLYHDAVRMFATAVRELDEGEEIEASKINCKHPSAWPHGARITNYMKIVGAFKFIAQSFCAPIYICLYF